MPLHTKANEFERCCVKLIQLLETNPALLNEGERMRLEMWASRLLTTIESAAKK